MAQTAVEACLARLRPEECRRWPVMRVYIELRLRILGVFDGDSVLDSAEAAILMRQAVTEAHLWIDRLEGDERLAPLPALQESTCWQACVTGMTRSGRKFLSLPAWQTAKQARRGRSTSRATSAATTGEPSTSCTVTLACCTISFWTWNPRSLPGFRLCRQQMGCGLLQPSQALTAVVDTGGLQREVCPGPIKVPLCLQALCSVHPAGVSAARSQRS
jgi:hypothetical protein